MGHRDENGWQVDVQSNKPVKIKAGRSYDVLVAVNGTNVTLIVEGVNWFIHDYAPRILDGEPVGLNRGMVGLGADQSRTTFDNMTVQVLPPELTFEYEEDFEDGVADLFTGEQSGAWALNTAKRNTQYDGTVGVGATGLSLVDLGGNLHADAYLEIEATVSTGATGGIVFDHYAEDDFKFVALDVDSNQLLFGHVDPKRGWTVDSAVALAYTVGEDDTLSLAFKGASVSARVNGAMVGSFGCNAAVVDGRIGVFTRNGASSFDEVTIGTNDPTVGPTVPDAQDAAAQDGPFSALTLNVLANDLWTEGLSENPGVTQPASGTATADTLCSTVDSGELDAAVTYKRPTVATLEIVDSRVVRDVNVLLDITHARAEDLSVFLVAPDGARIELFSNIASQGLTFTGIILDDDAETSMASGLSAFDAVYRPEGDLGALEGKTLSGTWALEVVDTTRAADGVLNSWSLVIEY